MDDVGPQQRAEDAGAERIVRPAAEVPPGATNFNGKTVRRSHAGTAAEREHSGLGVPRHGAGELERVALAAAADGFIPEPRGREMQDAEAGHAARSATMR